MTKIKKINGLTLERAFKSATNNLSANKEYVNSLNVFPVPDGDTGTNMYMTLSSATNSIEQTESVSSVMKNISRGALMGARGNSGVILSQILKGMSNGLEDVIEAGIVELNNAFQESKNSAYKAVMKPTEGTILTVVRGVAEFSHEVYEDYDDVFIYLQDVIKHGNEVLDDTPNMLKELKEAGVVDAGGKGYLIILEGILKGIISDDIDYEINVDNFKMFADMQNHDPDEIKFSYCTEFMINGQMDNPEDFREGISQFGDCVIVVNDDDITKVHIHTNNPGHILEEAVQFGFLSDIKIDNMKIQTSTRNNIKNSEKEEMKKFDFVVVSSGSGIKEIFNSIGINKIIEGGQTMNPSTEDLLKAVEETNAEDIYVFPNNKNIILSAKQIVELTDKNVHIIETRQIPEAFTAILSFNPDSSPEENLESMNEAIEEVTTIQITHAIRDSVNNGLEINEGDFIGLIHDKILKADKDITHLILDMLEDTVTEDNYLITIYSGEDINDEDAESLQELVEEKYSDLDIELVFGKQAVYHYLISIE